MSSVAEDIVNRKASDIAEDYRYRKSFSCLQTYYTKGEQI